MKKYKHIWIRNIIKNITCRQDIIDVAHLSNTAYKLPILLCAGGPSLEFFAHTLPLLKEKMIIVCVDTALSVCKIHNVVPDFVVTVDPQYINSKHLEFSLNWAISKGAQLLIDVSANSRILNMIPSDTPVYMSYNSQVLAQALSNRTTLLPRLQSGGSVATFALDFCRLLGSQKIYTMGLDLSYPRKKSHASGTLFEEWDKRTHSRLINYEQLGFEKISNAPSSYQITAYDGTTVNCDARLKQYRIWIEQYLERNTNHENPLSIYTFSPTSGVINGMKLIEIRDVEKLEYMRDTIDQVYQKIVDSVRCNTKKNDVSPIKSDNTVRTKHFTKTIDKGVIHENLVTLSIHLAQIQNQMMQLQTQIKKNTKNTDNLVTMLRQILGIPSMEIIRFYSRNSLSHISDNVLHTSPDRDKKVYEILQPLQEMCAYILSYIRDNCDGGANNTQTNHKTTSTSAHQNSTGQYLCV